MYHQFNIQQFYVLPTHCIYVFCVISEQTAIISLYNINWLVFITDTLCVYCAVRTGHLNMIFTALNEPNTNINTLFKCQYCLHAYWRTEKLTFEEVSWTADWLPLKVTQSSRGRHAQRAWLQTFYRKLTSFYGVLFPRSGWPLQSMSPTTAPKPAGIPTIRMFGTPSAHLTRRLEIIFWDEFCVAHLQHTLSVVWKLYFETSSVSQ